MFKRKQFRRTWDDVWPKELPFGQRVSYFYHEIKYIVRYLPILRKIFDAWYYSKCALWKKYNRVHVKTLSPTWNDRDILLEHAMFQILDDFVTKENIDEVIDWEHTPETKAARQKMSELLDWWENVYLKFDSYADFDVTKCTPRDQMFTLCEDGMYEMHHNEYEKEFSKNANKSEEEMRKELTKRMKEIVDIRHYFWT